MAHRTNPTIAQFDNTSAALFRAWASIISNALTAAGIPKTPDTGQIDLTTVAAPGALNTSMGYEIRRLNDTLQATKPVFFKIEYGSGQATSGPSTWLTVGTGSDGAGNITGILYARFQLSMTANSPSTNNKAVLSGDVSWFVCQLSFANYHMGFFIERTKDVNGADTDYGVLVGAWQFNSNQSGTGSGAFRVCPFVGSLPAVETKGNAILPLSGSTQKGASVGIFPLIMFEFGEDVNPPTSLFIYRQGDIGPESAFFGTLYGTSTREYYGTDAPTNVSRDTTNTPRLAVRYED